MRFGKLAIMVVIALLAPWTLMATHVPSPSEKIEYEVGIHRLSNQDRNECGTRLWQRRLADEGPAAPLRR